MAARRNKTELSDAWKEKIGVSMLMNRLKKHIDGEIELQQTQLKAIELILQRTVPSLSAVEQTNIEPEKALTESDLLAQMGAFLAAHPDLAQQAIGEYAKKQHDAAQQKPDLAVVPMQQVISKVISK